MRGPSCRITRATNLRRLPGLGVSGGLVGGHFFARRHELSVEATPTRMRRVGVLAGAAELIHLALPLLALAALLSLLLALLTLFALLAAAQGLLALLPLLPEPALLPPAARTTTSVPSVR